MRIDWSEVAYTAYTQSWYIWLILLVLGIILIRLDLDKKSFNVGINMIAVGIVFNIIGAISIVIK